METKTDRTAMIALVAGGIALLLGLCLGALGGGVAGYLMGRQVGERANHSEDAPGLLPGLPETPELPQMPELPALPRGLMNASGALVREVLAGSPAQRAGLQVGDLITGVDDMPVDRNHSLVDALATFSPGDRVELQIWRAGRTRTIELTLGKHPDDSSRPYLGIRYVDLSLEPRQPGPQD